MYQETTMRLAFKDALGRDRGNPLGETVRKSLRSGRGKVKRKQLWWVSRKEGL